MTCKRCDAECVGDECEYCKKLPRCDHSVSADLFRCYSCGAVYRENFWNPPGQYVGGCGAPIYCVEYYAPWWRYVPFIDIKRAIECAELNRGTIRGPLGPIKQSHLDRWRSRNV